MHEKTYLTKYKQKQFNKGQAQSHQINNPTTGNL